MIKVGKKTFFLWCIQIAFLSVLGIFGLQAKGSRDDPPKLTVVVVIDQFAFHYIPKLQKHFKYGLKDLLNNGIPKVIGPPPCKALFINGFTAAIETKLKKA